MRPTGGSPSAWTAPRSASASGGEDSAPSGSRDSLISNARGARAVFPPEQVAEVKAIACELPATHGLPLGRFTRTELHRLVIERGVTDASASTIWRWLHDDAIRPWQQRSWLFMRDPDFAAKAARVLDLYQRRFEGKRLRPDEYVISADEKSQLQALGRRHPTLAPGPGRPTLVEFDYRRGGTLAYLAAWDVHHANLFGRVEEKTGIEPFGRLVEEVMATEPYASAKRVFWVVDNGSSHAGQTSMLLRRSHRRGGTDPSPSEGAWDTRARSLRAETLPRPSGDVRCFLPARLALLHAGMRCRRAERRGHRRHGRPLLADHLAADRLPDLADGRCGGSRR